MRLQDIFASKPAHALDETSDKRAGDPCWDGYKQVGLKDKDGKKVPNCVPDKPKRAPKKP